jgi:hypothetical protein
VKVASGKVGYTGQLRQREFVVQVRSRYWIARPTRR